MPTLMKDKLADLQIASFERRQLELEAKSKSIFRKQHRRYVKKLSKLSFFDGSNIAVIKKLFEERNKPKYIARKRKQSNVKAPFMREEKRDQIQPRYVSPKAPPLGAKEDVLPLPPIIRPKAEYDNKSPYGIASELHQSKVS